MPVTKYPDKSFSVFEDLRGFGNLAGLMSDSYLRIYVRVLIAKIPVLRIFPDSRFYSSKEALAADNIFTRSFQPKKPEMPPFAQRRHFPVRHHHGGLIVICLIIKPPALPPC
jgi:hypothetical protein